MIWTQAFWKATAERAIRTFAQVLGAILGVNVVGGVMHPGMQDVDWGRALSIATFATILAVLMCVGTGLVPNNVGPGLTETPQAPDSLDPAV